MIVLCGGPQGFCELLLVLCVVCPIGGADSMKSRSRQRHTVIFRNQGATLVAGNGKYLHLQSSTHRTLNMTVFAVAGYEVEL